MSLPKSLVKRRKQALDDLQKTILQSLDSYKLRSQSIIRSGNSYVAVVFGTTKTRERALRRLEKVEISFEGKTVEKLVYNFGDASGGKSPTLWAIPVGFSTTLEEMLKAYTSYLNLLRLWTRWMVKPLLSKGAKRGDMDEPRVKKKILHPRDGTPTLCD